jgi:hypothetical protein
LRRVRRFAWRAAMAAGTAGGRRALWLLLRFTEVRIRIQERLPAANSSRMSVFSCHDTAFERLAGSC